MNCTRTAFFWFGFRCDKNGQRIEGFDDVWSAAVSALGKKMKDDGLNGADERT